jgi:exodeoxyribonuclease VII large subunit
MSVDPGLPTAGLTLQNEGVSTQGQFDFTDEQQVLQVSELLERVRRETESQFRGVWIQGEISNLRRPGSGHLYFTLKDRDSQLAAVCFRMQLRYLRFEPEDGMEVVVRGTVTVYPARGQLQVVVDHMEPQGRGALQLAFEKLKAQLFAEGLFDPVRKRPLPLLPSRIGVVTSPSGAAIQDILRVLQQRNDRVSVLIYPARVQGREAAAEIAAGIRYLDSRPDIDVIIVGRGGGSLEDLWPFNEEVVARAIYAAETPVISAVGHEIDVTISDFVADLRAPTPSAAAELVCGRWEDLDERIRQLSRRLLQSIRLHLAGKRQALARLTGSRGLVDVEARVRLIAQRLDDLTERLRVALPPLLRDRRMRIDLLDRELQRRIEQRLQNLRHLLQSRLERLKAYSPMLVLERGYAIVTDSGGRIIRSPEAVAVKELIHVRVARGEFRARKEPD